MAKKQGYSLTYNLTAHTGRLCILGSSKLVNKTSINLTYKTKALCPPKKPGEATWAQALPNPLQVPSQAETSPQEPLPTGSLQKGQHSLQLAEDLSSSIGTRTKSSLSHVQGNAVLPLTPLTCGSANWSHWFQWLEAAEASWHMGCRIADVQNTATLQQLQDH